MFLQIHFCCAFPRCLHCSISVIRVHRYKPSQTIPYLTKFFGVYPQPEKSEVKPLSHTCQMLRSNRILSLLTNFQPYPSPENSEVKLAKDCARSARKFFSLWFDLKSFRPNLSPTCRQIFRLIPTLTFLRSNRSGLTCHI